MKLKENKGAANSVVIMLMVFILILICLLFYVLKNPMVKYVEKDLANTQTQTVVAEVQTTAETSTSKTTQNEVSKNELNIDVMDKIFQRLNFVQTLEFTSTSKITEKEIHNLLISYFSVNSFADASKYSQAEIKQLVKDILNKDYSGSFNIEAEGDGEGSKSIAVSNIKKENNNYIVKYAVINYMDADDSDDVAGYYEAKLDENLVFISNKKI